MSPLTSKKSYVNETHKVDAGVQIPCPPHAKVKTHMNEGNNWIEFRGETREEVAEHALEIARRLTNLAREELS